MLQRAAAWLLENNYIQRTKLPDRKFEDIFKDDKPGDAQRTRAQSGASAGLPPVSDPNIDR